MCHRESLVVVKLVWVLLRVSQVSIETVANLNFDIGPISSMMYVGESECKYGCSRCLAASTGGCRIRAS